MNFFGAFVYLLVAVAAIVAVRAARQAHRPTHDMVQWFVIASGFVLLAVTRIAGLEELARASLREWVRTQDLYDARGDFQSVAAVLIILLATATAFALWRMWEKRRRSRAGKARFFALLALFGYIPLWGLRLVSFHATDRILYASPIHLNWIIDGSLALACALGALYYARETGRQSRPRGAR